ncbi:MAG: hypothetical protein RL441_1420 [Actinomycetota bacterium]|jgi:uncharacterized membrane protein
MARHKSLGRHWSLPVIAGVAVALVGLALKSACAPWSWGGSAETYSRLCYSDLGPLYWLRGMADGVIPYFQSYDGQYIEYPVLTGMWMWLIAIVTHAMVGGQSVGTFVALTWATSVVFIAGTLALMARNSTSNRHASWWFALSPALLLTLGINWDALAVMCAVGALIMYQRGRMTAAGLLIGVGAAAKLFPALLLVPIVANALGRRNLKDAIRVSLVAAATWIAINLPFFVFARDGWWEFYRFSRERGIDFGSLPLALSYLFNLNITTSQANTFGLVAVAAASLVILVMNKKLSVYQSSFIIVAVFVLANKVYSPQFWLWLTALLVMTGISRAAFIGWNIAQLLYFYGIWHFLLYTTDPRADGALGPQAYGAIILIQWIATAVIVSLTFSSRKS